MMMKVEVTINLNINLSHIIGWIVLAMLIL